jgi:hypothetical protein
MFVRNSVDAQGQRVQDVESGLNDEKQLEVMARMHCIALTYMA